jgi:hypothetical protein
VPRGGARRRKSMEPKALANLNGMLVSTPAGKQAQRECQTEPRAQPPPATPANRRDSCLWVRTPESEDDDAPHELDREADWALLTPVPKTPAPEMVARYAAEVSEPATPSEYADMTFTSEREELLARTAPQPSRYADLGRGVLGEEKDEMVMRRLVAARRKSLQYAPKVGSPLSRAWA